MLGKQIFHGYTELLMCLVEQSARRMLHWEVARKLAAEPLQSAPPSSSALLSVTVAPEPLDTSVDLNLGSGSTDGLAMATELQTLLAEMDWG